jgi:Na+(H+)/acetate symporter ActP
MALVLGTMGLPHIIVRFHTSPDGRAARRTAAITVALLSAFYLFPAVYGTLGAVLVPELYLSGDTDTVVVALPGRVDGGPLGVAFTAMLSAGAFAAFLATSLGLLLALSSAVAHDLLPGAGLRRLRLAPLACAVVIVALALPAVNLDVGVLVTAGFAVAASTFCPLLVLGIWWPRLTASGAVAGLVVGLVASVGAIGVDLFLGAPAGLASILLAQPALWTVPLAFAVMVGVSLRGRPPAWAAAATLRLHLDETAV